MNWLKAIGYGFVLFSIGFVLGSVVMFGFKLSGMAMGLAMMVIMAVVLYVLAKQYGIKSLNDGIQIGLVWLVVDALCEYYVLVQIFNKGNLAFYSMWTLWVGYALVVAIPALVGSKK